MDRNNNSYDGDFSEYYQPKPSTLGYIIEDIENITIDAEEKIEKNKEMMKQWQELLNDLNCALDGARNLKEDLQNFCRDLSVEASKKPKNPRQAQARHLLIRSQTLFEVSGRLRNIIESECKYGQS